MRQITPWLLLIILLVPQSYALARPPRQEADPDVEAIFQQMSPEERVGQLFVVTFQGTDVSSESNIADLINNYHIGGVILLADYDNFAGEGSLPERVYDLTQALQAVPTFSDDDATPPRVSYIPLFVGVEHDGSGGMTPQLLSGLSPLSSEMAIGATWDKSLAEATGQVLGEELSAMGINLLIGPSADVVEEIQPFPGDLGTQEFGGEPYWVSQMAAAYVLGVHEGSGGRIAVFPRYFPGHGGADRVASIEIPTVRRSLDELRQVDLKPFFAVTAVTENPMSQADGLLTGHIQYGGFQGDNVRQETAPISLDFRLADILALEPIASWHTQGGLIMSDALGVRGISTHYDPTNSNPQGRYRKIAQDALQAGNDLLYLGKFDPNANVDQVAIVKDAMGWFVQKYESDQAFHARVDNAVRRILRAKLDLYGATTFNVAQTIQPRANLESIGGQGDVTTSVAQRALTLLHPSRIDLLNAPQDNDQFVIFTDTREVRQCSTCVPQPIIAKDALQSQIFSQYGPEATGDVSFSDIQSFTFQELQTYYELGAQASTNAEGTPQPNGLELALNSADWVVFVMMDISPEVPASAVIKRYLANLPVGVNIVVFAMGGPYYLDATDVSKLTAYYALYGTSGPFLSVAAQALFLDAPPQGASPVSVSAIGYEIFDVTSPNPAQVIHLVASKDVTSTPTPEAPLSETVTPTASATPGDIIFQQGDRIVLTTSVIVDKNNKAVPDGTPVTFRITYPDSMSSPQDPQPTVNGVARFSFTLDQQGTYQVTASSAPASTSDQVTLPTGGSPIVATPVVTPTLNSAETVTEEASQVGTTAPVPTPTETGFMATTPNVKFGDLYLTLFGLLIIAALTFAYGYRARDLNYALLLALPVLLGGLVFYNYYAMLLPGSGRWREFVTPRFAAAVASWFGGLIGLGVMLGIIYGGVPWMRRSLRDRR